ncbi:unnamed protein product [Vitrella brassicaformis CCMP3155]|uniref:Uncharacterized protein n=1 Tax=Vitrella brassicaformis (strain CCMP3155) TaxID=1169540 RepID=A0A0G4GXK8_VITBC|nr:unnamed protein product [Vitrella brassicaformis CCMP3155]|eukprot:CEM35582.1 unnamed protein product [Vitrella brassicaformis CCMP3155]
MSEGSLKSLTFEPAVLPGVGIQEITEISYINSRPPQTAPSQSIPLPALTEVNCVIPGHSLIDGRGWATPAVEVVSAPYDTAQVADIRPFVATSRSLVELETPLLLPPSDLAQLMESIPLGQRGSPGPLARLRTIPSIKLYGMESDVVREGLERLKRCLCDRGCSKSLKELGIVVHRSDCHSVFLKADTHGTFKALGNLIDRVCLPSGYRGPSYGRVNCHIRTDGQQGEDVPMDHRLGYLRWDLTQSPRCHYRLLWALLRAYHMEYDDADCDEQDCPSFWTSPRPPCQLVWRITPADLDPLEQEEGDRRAGPHACRMMFSWRRTCSVSIQCADGWTPPANAVLPSHPELRIFRPGQMGILHNLTVKSRIGLGAARVLISRGVELQSLQVMDMDDTDVMGFLTCLTAWKMPSQLVLGSVQPGAGMPVPFYHGSLRKAKMLTASGDGAMGVAAALRQQMASLDMLAMSGGEAGVRQVLTNGGREGIGQLRLGFMAEGDPELIEAEDEREGIRLGTTRTRCHPSTP